MDRKPRAANGLASAASPLLPRFIFRWAYWQALKRQIARIISPGLYEDGGRVVKPRENVIISRIDQQPHVRVKAAARRLLPDRQAQLRLAPAP
jgi:hypothetical protein